MIRSARNFAIAIILLSGQATFAHAQTGFGPLPFTDPQRMFERMFGEDSPADREALRKIKISADDERELGKKILAAGLAAWKEEGIQIVSKGRDVEYLQSLVETLRPHMTNRERYPRIDVRVAKSPRVDARSCPGGTLIFFEGLLDAADSEAALVGIVGHELSHLDRGHQLLPLKRMKLMEKQFTQGFDPENFFQSGPGMIRLMARPFRPEDERDADRDGAAWAFAAGYDPREMAKLFLRLAEQAKEHEAAPGDVSSFFRTHPYNRDRHQAILQQFAKLRRAHPQQELFVGKENLRLRKSRQQTDDE